MYKVINKSHFYAIHQCKEGFYDTNGGFYRNLLISQRRFLNDFYDYEIEQLEDTIVLHIFLTEVEQSGDTIIFTETEAGTQCYKDGIISSTGVTLSTEKMFKYAKNQEVLLSYLALILERNHYYSKLLNFIDYYFNLNEDPVKVYISIYDMLLNGHGNILSDFVENDMTNMLIVFCKWYNKEKPPFISNLSQLIEILRTMETISTEYFGLQLKIYEYTYSYKKENPIKLNESMIQNIIRLIDMYGKENTKAFSQFISVIHELNAKASIFRKNSVSIINEAICLLIEIKKLCPDSTFNENVNYIFSQMFGAYNFSLTAEGIIDILNIWKKYLAKNNDEESIYPDDIKKITSL